MKNPSKGRSCEALPRQLHAAGVVRNFSPKPARMRRELLSFVANVRKVLWRRPGVLILWTYRDRKQAAFHGHGFFSHEVLKAGYAGRVIGIGWRAIVVFTGRAPL